MDTLFQVTKNASVAVDKFQRYDQMRTPYSILASAMSEMGELGEEVQISQGHSYKKPGVDGIVGEAVDTILCLLDLIHVVDPTITEEQLSYIALSKSAKWAHKVKERNKC